MENPQLITSHKSVPLLTLPVMGAAVRLSTAHLLISPGTQVTDAQLQALPPVTDIIGASLWHMGGVANASRIFPEARRWGVPHSKPPSKSLAWTHTITKSSWPYNHEIAAIPLDGMPAVNEIVFVHHASKTLIVSDMCFNLRNVSGFFAKLFLRSLGTYERFGVSKFFARQIRDQSAFAHSLSELFSYDFERVIMGHGEVLQYNGKEQLRAALAERGLSPQTKLH